MPKIPISQYTPQASQPINVRANPGMFDGEAQAIQRLGQGVANLGQGIGAIADANAAIEKKVQGASDFKASATLDLALQEAWDKFQNGRNKATDETKWVEEWQKIHAATVEANSPKGARKELADKLAFQANAFKVLKSGDVGQQAKVVGLDKASRAGLALADVYFQDGDIGKAEEKLNEMAAGGLIYKEQIPEMMRQGSRRVADMEAKSWLRALAALPPADKKRELDQFDKDLFEKGEDGSFAGFKFKDGGLTAEDRLAFRSRVVQEREAAQRQMDTSGHRLVSGLRSGRMTLDNVKVAVESGEIDRETAALLSPDLILAMQERDDKLAEKAGAEAKRQQNSLESLRNKALNGRGSVSARDIKRDVGLGEISGAGGAQLTEELSQASRAELAGGDAEIIRNNIRGGWASKLFGRQPSEDSYRELQNAILAAKLTKPTRLALVNELLDLKLADIADLEEEGGDWIDRAITKPEKSLRVDMIQQYKILLEPLGDTLAGDLMFNQEAEIRNFFDSAPDGKRTHSEIEAFKNTKLLPIIRNAAAQDALEDIFN